MINFSQLNEIQILMFALIFLRMIAFITTAAVFSTENISIFVKILFSLVLTLVVFNSVASSQALVRLHENQNDLIMLAIREVFVGISLGFVTRLFFFSLSMAGEIISVSIGLGQAQMFNPMMGAMGNAVEQFYAIIGTLVYLTLDGHHILIQGLIDSFKYIDVAHVSYQMTALPDVVFKAQYFFILGIKMAAPVLISMIIVQVGIALLSRAVPQINVLMTSASITALLGIVIIIITLPLLVMQITGLLDMTSIEFFNFIKAI